MSSESNLILTSYPTNNTERKKENTYMGASFVLEKRNSEEKEVKVSCLIKINTKKIHLHWKGGKHR